jgi:hypothetical protein
MITMINGEAQGMRGEIHEGEREFEANGDRGLRGGARSTSCL